MTARQLARALTTRARMFSPRPGDAEELTFFAVAQVRARMTRRGRAALAIRLVYVALTGRKPLR